MVYEYILSYGIIEEDPFFLHCTNNTKKLNPVASVHDRTIPTERLTLVGEVSANFCG
jgi:hypothetical protein